MDILISDEVRYFRLDDDKLSSLKPSDMSDPSIMLQRYTKQKIKNPQFFIFVYSMIRDRVSISEKFVGLTMKPTSKSISALLKLELIKTVLSSNKISRKRKKYLVFFHTSVSSPRV
jgi:hypothetical protein